MKQSDMWINTPDPRFKEGAPTSDLGTSQVKEVDLTEVNCLFQEARERNSGEPTLFIHLGLVSCRLIRQMTASLETD